MRSVLLALLLFVCIRISCYSQRPTLMLPAIYYEDIRISEFSSDGKYLATGHIDGKIRLWEPYSGKLLRTFIGHNKEITSLLFDKESKNIFSTAIDNSPIMWDLYRGKEKYHLAKMDWNIGYVKAKYNAKGDIISTISFDGIIRLWRADDGKLIREMGEKRSKFIAGNQVTKLFKNIDFKIEEDIGKVVSIFDDSVINIYNYNTGKLIRPIMVHGSTVTGIQISSDTKYLYSSSLDSTIVKTRLDDFKFIYGVKLDFPVVAIEYLKEHDILIPMFDTAILLFLNSENFRSCLSPLFLGNKSIINRKVINDSIWVLSFHDSTCSVINILGGEILFNARINNSIYPLGVCNNNLFCIGSSPPVIVNWKNSKYDILDNNNNNYSPKPLSISQNGQYLVISSNNKKYCLQVWDIITGKTISYIEDNGNTVTHASISGNRVFTTFIDSSFKIWDITTGSLIDGFKLDGYISSYTDEDSNFIAMGTSDGNVYLFNKRKMAVTKKIKVDSSPIYNIVICNNQILTTDELGNVLYSDLNTGIVKEITSSFPRKKYPFKEISNLIVSKDGKYFCILGKDSLVLYNFQFSKIHIYNYHRISRVISAEFDANSQNIICLYADGSIESFGLDGINHNDIFINPATYSKNENKMNYFSWNDITDKGKRIYFFTDSNFLCAISDSCRVVNIKTKKSVRSIATDAFAVCKNGTIITRNDQIFSVFHSNNTRSYNFLLFSDKSNLIYLDDAYYYCDRENSKKLYYVTQDLKIITFDQLDLKYNRPDKVLRAIGNIDTGLIKSYEMAYFKRLKKLHIDTTSFNDNFNVPEADFTNRDKIDYEQSDKQLKLHIKGNDKNALLERFNLYINGSPLFGVSGINIRNRKKHVFDSTITITLSAGKNVLTTSVFNINGIESYRMPLVVNYTLTQHGQGKTYFIGIGANHFADASHNLNYSAKDIRDLLKALKSKYGDQLIADTFIDEQVDKQSIIALKQKLLHTNVDDKIIIAYSGHGLIGRNKDYYLSTFKVSFNNPQDGGLLYDDLESLLDKIPARKKLLLIDACNSGELDKDAGKEVQQNALAVNTQGRKGATVANIAPNVGLTNTFDLMQDLFVNVSRNTGAIIIAASKGTQSALEKNEFQNGVFTHAILEFMNQNGHANVNDLKQHVNKRVIELTHGDQVPTAREENHEFDWQIW